MDKITFFRTGQIKNDIRRIETVLSQGLFELDGERQPLTQAAFTELMVCLNDLLQKASDLGVPVTFTDDVPPDLKTRAGGTPNITDLVNLFRNTVCHISSKNRFFFSEDEEKSLFQLEFGIWWGGTDDNMVLAQVGNVKLVAKYGDDLGFIFGPYIIYYRRQIVRAFEEAKRNLEPHLPAYP